MEYSPLVKELFDKYGIEDGRHIKISHLVQMSSDFQKLDRETKKEIIAMIPEYQAKMLEAVGKCKEFYTTVLSSNDESEARVYNMYESALNGINERLNKTDISDEERKLLLSQQAEYLKAMHEKDTEGKKFRFAHSRLLTILAGAGVGGVIYLITNGKVEGPRA